MDKHILGVVDHIPRGTHTHRATFIDHADKHARCYTRQSRRLTVHLKISMLTPNAETLMSCAALEANEARAAATLATFVCSLVALSTDNVWLLHTYFAASSPHQWLGCVGAVGVRG